MTNDQPANDKSTGGTDTTKAVDEPLPVAEGRAADYYPAAAEVCPRCHAEDYRPIQDARGHDVRQCVSCGLIYTPDDAGPGVASGGE